MVRMFVFPVQGDYTRTGEIRFAGMMKDGVNSANRSHNFLLICILTTLHLTYQPHNFFV